MRRCFISGLLAEEMVISGEDAHHILHALRFKVGGELTIVDAARKVARARIVETGGGWVKAALIAEIEDCTEPPVEVVLAQCLPKSDKMDFIVQKAVELGVGAVCPVVSENCVVKYDAAKREARRQKWQKIAREAAKQCGRAAVPKVLPILALKDLASLADGKTELIFCYEQEDQRSIRTLLEESRADRFLLLVGPEGGFSAGEAAFCRSLGFQSVTLGSRILRAETASLAALSIVMYQNGDLGGGR